LWIVKQTNFEIDM